MGRGFKSLYLHLDSIAQLVELSALNRKVVGSIPTGITALKNKASRDVKKKRKKENNMVDTLEVYEVGTDVVLSEDIQAKIVTVAIHAENIVQYECAWWSGETRTRDWFTLDDFTVKNHEEPTKIGFLRGDETCG